MGGGGYNNMTELPSSPSQRLMIAKSNDIYIPALLALDGMDANRRSAARSLASNESWSFFIKVIGIDHVRIY
jgi:hypothetical protein